MISFYIFSPANFQDMFPLIFHYLEKKEKCWLCFFDCVFKKRQLRDYSFEEIFLFFKKKCKELNLVLPKISFYRKDDQLKYLKDYNDLKPKIVYIQETSPKYPHWFPSIAKESKVICFTWWYESKNIFNSKIKVDLAILKRDNYKKYFKGINSKYFGNIFLDHLNYHKNNTNNKLEKSCFIPESYLRMNSKNIKDSMLIAKQCDKIIYLLKKNNFKIIWKKREKGYPKENEYASPLEFCNNKPDIIYEKDLNFPSCMYSESYDANICLIINDCFAFFDLIEINKNTFILLTEGARSRLHVIDKFFKEKYSANIIDLKTKSGWEKFNKIIKSDLKNEIKNLNSNISCKIADYCSKL